MSIWGKIVCECTHLSALQKTNEKGEEQMNNKKYNKVLLRVLVAILAATLLFGIFAAPQAEASSYKASYINLMKDVPGLNLKDYLDSSVAYQLPEGVKDDDAISIIITLDIVNLMDAYENTDKTMSFGEYALQSDDAKEIQNKIADKKAEVLNKLDQLAITYTMGDDYSVLLSGFEIGIRAGDFKAICKSLDSGMNVMVCEVYQVAETQLVENKVNVYDTGIIDSSNVEYKGDGMVVAVLDTGVDYAHSAFSTNNFQSSNLGLTYDKVASLLGNTLASQQVAGLTVDDVFISDKIPFGFDYADKDANPYSTHNNHGTHVSGIIVGKDDTITGVAPNAQLVSMKVFSDVYDSAISSWILSALEDCVVLGVDVINMSLGTAAGFARESDEELMFGVYEKIRQAGISLIVAASNSYNSAFGSDKNGNLPLTSNPDSGTVGSPGTYDGAMSVASINGVKTPYIKHGETIMYFNETNTNAGKENSFFDTLLGSENAKDFEFVVIPGVGRTADYSGLDVNGKIALVRRGDTTFEEKAMIAQKQGAAGIIIYNNVAGDIKMNIGEATLAGCSISQDDGEKLAATGGGVLTISKDQKSGPFMSDFSSWGPTPSLQIKPEITQHGGNILSAVTGGSYDRLSGTSMACPNVAGLALLMRQYVVKNFPDIANDDVAVNHMVYRLMMSTADIVINKNGQPYAVRKQGAGLANLVSAIESKAVIMTYDKDGKVMDKTKLELGDDKQKTGVYEMSFTVKNFGTGALSYDLGAYVLTEGVSDTLTAHGLTTVTETAYPLTGATFEVVSVSGGTVSDKNLTVDAGQEAKVTVKITLGEEDKKYLDESFENGMYVEGFITLTATAGTEVDMSVPYLAFYGDWTVAPQLDLDYFETNADELDDSIAMQDKVMPDAYATRPIGGLSEDYISYLGSYYFVQNPSDMVIAANKDFIALSNQEGTVHSLRYIWTGMMRNAAKVVVTITDDTTGEVIFETVDYDVRKSYGDGGPIYPAGVDIEFDTMDYNLKNNTEYTVRMETYLDYEDGGKDTNEKNVFEFPLVIDFEAPVVNDVEFRYEYDNTLEKNRLYADVAVFDNHHAMSMQLGYVTTGYDSEGQPSMEMRTFDQFMTPVYSVRNGTTVVTFELTDYINELKESWSENHNTAFVVTCYDYALNNATYEIGMPSNYLDFFMDGLVDNTLVLSPNELYSMNPLVYPVTEWAELLNVRSSHPGIADVVNGKIVAKEPGVATIIISDPADPSIQRKFKVKVLEEGDEGFQYFDKPAVDQFKLTGYVTQKAYYMLASEDKKIGDTGDMRFFNGNDYSLSMYPSESVWINYELHAYFPNDTYVEYSSADESIVKVDPTSGVITAVAEGYSTITATVYLDEQATYYTASISVEVKDPYVVSGGMLTHYYGNGGVVAVPERLGISTIYNFAFSNFEYVMKTPEELAYDDQSLTKQWFIGDNTITKIILPEGVEKIGSYAFANLTLLEEIVLPSTLTEIDYGAFYGCKKLTKITFSGENNLKIINKEAFAGCDITGQLDLPSAYVISDYAFANNQNLTGIKLPETLQTIGAYAFANCAKLSKVDINADKVKFGDYAFLGCTALTNFEVNSSLIPAGMFYRCTNLKEVTIGPDVKAINEFAFNDTALNTFHISEGNTAFKVQDANYVLSADGKQLIAVAPSVSGQFTAANIGGNEVTSIGRGAFSHNMLIDSVDLPMVTEIGAYAFGYYDESRGDLRSALKNVSLGHLTNIGEYAFYGVRISVLPSFDANTTIGRYAFANSYVTFVEIPDNMVLAEGVFADCRKLETVVIGDNVTIGDFAFLTDKNYHFEIKTHLDKETNKTSAWYEFSSALKNITIGENAVIGKNAFAYAASVESIELGDNAKIGYMAFYNCSSLKQIDLSKVLSIGEQAFSGDVYEICIDSNMSTPVVSADGKYQYSYHAAKLAEVDLSSVEEAVGAYAFAFCKELTKVTLGDNITKLGAYAFANCEKLTEINLSKIVEIDEYALLETAVTAVDLTSATEIGKYAFANCAALENVTLNNEGSVIREGAFVYDKALKKAENLQFATVIEAYAFAHAGLLEADLSGAVKIGDNAFMKETLTPFTVKLGELLVELGDNPFAFCAIAPFSKLDTVEFNGKEYSTEIYDFSISEKVQVVDGSLYCVVPNGGMELITYTGRNPANVKVAEGTVRVTAYAFAGSDVKMVTLPYTVAALGHKAFFGCDKLSLVVFTSYDAPILEEEFDSTYFESYKNLPGSGKGYGTYTDFDGKEVEIKPLGVIPYFMWNVYGAYSNVFYGANFVDYIGHVDSKLTMVRPSNGEHYETFIFNQYFDLVIDGDVAADDATLAAIAAINQIPERVELTHEAIVAAARAAYNKIATLDQQALVENYGKLLSAEQRIAALKAAQQTGEEPAPVEPSAPVNVWMIVAIVALVLLAAAGVAITILAMFIRRNSVVAEETIAVEEAATPAVEEEVQTETETEEIESKTE